ncbi:Intermembrane phospholipid transport system ATP-binding protein MlaF [Vibrio stylophorae]|uniref:Intermembrane phospholipid transport system ATP-binding protein MlaF n=1 Tax=Vibrio stylophorae TaxID=659351 RepID=A0ABN8DQQ6_9VIBR|nr:phospholipid ABC transporter ATP-binding protein MlaF [Vibrio stylophorae]CAH0532504.1 Intermembrane phospholipid transport system ATP-binding protein MlaF [Vibrio stylophorae]
MAQNENLITIRDLHFCRGERVIFDHLNLNIPKGKVTAIMGPSGIGKTTLLRLIGGQLLPDQGDIFFHQWNIPKLGRRALYTAREKMGMLFQSGALFSDMSVFDNIAFPLREHTQLSESLIATIVMLKLEAVGLRGAEALMPSELSGGMARRVALARAIVLDPELVMYDEPFVGQDPITMGVLVKLIRDLNQALGLTSVVVSHDVPEVMSIADYVYLLADGKVIAEGTPEALEQMDDDMVRQFIQGLADGPVPFRYPAKPLAEEWL